MIVPDAADDRRTLDRRLAVAVLVSMVLHALTIASVRAVIPTVPATPPTGLIGSAAIQAVLAGPRADAEKVELPPPPAPAPKPVAAVQPAAHVIATPPLFRVERPVLPLQGAGASQGGVPNHKIRISVGLISDPAKVGPDYAVGLAQRFPGHISDLPSLREPPIVHYPPDALRDGIEARIAAVLTLDAEGKILEIALQPDEPLFGPAVLEALKTMHFAPADFGDKTVPYWAIVDFVFRIEHPGTGSSSVATAPEYAR